ncbi:redox-sensitive transcriptional activator SoxR [Lacimicrobium sp. SS2-24]|uniref:redox-sensitive transcriptional activator SoxR n=1 Tax=Lacimicrobium sp. SS2-24 TaxID=2005569 RepID=UPI000B4B073E|nr:redox-sensitive transcriptional activator SoxR [Lacimicrobium sp. SS2-24]
MQDSLTVGEVAKRAGIRVSTLHYYESIGLIASHRNTANHRRYKLDVLRRVSVIKAAQKMGIGLDSIKEAMSYLPLNQAPSKSDWKSLATFWQVELDNRINYLKNLRENLTGCIGCGCLSMENCPIYNENDKLAECGTGPILLDKNRQD